MSADTFTFIFMQNRFGSFVQKLEGFPAVQHKLGEGSAMLFIDNASVHIDSEGITVIVAQANSVEDYLDTIAHSIAKAEVALGVNDNYTEALEEASKGIEGIETLESAEVAEALFEDFVTIL